MPGRAGTEAGAPTLPGPRLPGPRLPIAVQTLLFGRYRQRWLPRLRRRYGDSYLIRLAPHRRRLVVLSRLADVRTVFAGSASVFHAGEGNAILRPIMGKHSVLLLDEDEHLRIRQLLMPAFHGASLRGYRQLITELTRAEVAGWPTGRPVRLHPRMQALTLEIILQVVFGVTDQGRLAELRPVVGRVVGVNPVIMLGWFYPRLRPLWPWRRFTDIRQDLDRVLYAEIAERRQAGDLGSRPDVLSQLLRLAGPGVALTDAELRDNLVTLLLAGHETTATALAWAFCELARDPELLRQAQQAADAGDENYLQALAKESMRLHPVLYQVARRVTEPVELGGYLVPAGATVVPAIGLLHADPRHHDDPTRCDPGRFLGGQPAAGSWIPFGGGDRRCLGAGFALLEATVVLDEVLRRYDLSAGASRPERAKARHITLAPSRGARVTLSRRTG